MKYLFSALDARQTRHQQGVGRSSASYHGQPPYRNKYNTVELKKLLADASEGVDEKSSAHDFVDTLERIVNEIKNTTDHSAAFLQKVRKTDVPDYYDIIKRPMDLATLQKRVKQQTYRTKKAFAEDLDLIWSNCLLYNSHPSHPLRRSAEFLRQRSNQLLEFITDPALPSRSQLAASYNAGQSAGTRSGGSGAGAKKGTPGLGDDGDGDDEGEPDGDTDDEMEETGVGLTAKGNKTGSSRTAGLTGVNKKLMQHVIRESTPASPSGSRSATPMADRGPHALRLGRGPLGRMPSTPIIDLPFEERQAIIRTAESMQTFRVLDEKLRQFDGMFDTDTITIGVNAKPAEPDAAVAVGKESLSNGHTDRDGNVSPKPTSRMSTVDTRSLRHLSGSLVSGIAPPPDSSLISQSSAQIGSSIGTSNPPTPVASTSTLPDASTSNILSSSRTVLAAGNGIASTLHSATTTNYSGDEEDEEEKVVHLEDMWWKAVADGNSSRSLASGAPHCPWSGGRVSSPDEVVPVAKRRSSTAKERAHSVKMLKRKAASVNGVIGKPRTANKQNSSLTAPTRRENKTSKSFRGLEEEANEEGLGLKMQKNYETLSKIRRLHSKLARTKELAELQDLPPLNAESLSEGSDSDVPGEHSSKVVSFLDTGIPPVAFRSHLADQAGRESLEIITNRILCHTGFDGASATALGILSHVTAEYIANLGRALCFYSNRYGSTMSSEDIILHVLRENGVPSASAIQSYVTEDIDRYGVKLADLHVKLQRARADQLEGGDGPVIGDEQVFARDCEALSLGEFSSHIGEDFFGFAELGLDRELGISSLRVPVSLMRGERRRSSGNAVNGAIEAELRYPPPPPYTPLPASAIESQIGLLRPLFRLRHKTEAGLVEDYLQRVRPKITRNKVPPSGRIPYKGKRKPDETPGNSLMKFKRRKLLGEGTGDSE